MSGGVLAEAYKRFHHTGPEWGENQLTNHGPMAAEVLVRRGRSDAVVPWVSRYLRRLDDLPEATNPVRGNNWREALGQGRRVTDWTVFFDRQLDEQPWREVLGTWWPRLLPGIVAGTTHGVIRVGHVVRALLAGAENDSTLAELAHALAFWAALARSLPVSATPAGVLDPAAALDGLPRIPSQLGTVAARFDQLPRLRGWATAVSALRPGESPEQVRTRLADLITASTVRYLSHGHASPVLLVHTATAPNAVLHTLPALPEQLWAPSLTAVWTVTAAMFSAYAPTHADTHTHAAEPAPLPPSASDPVAEVLDRAITHGDEHVIKFADTAAEVYTRTGQAASLAAALHIATLIAPN